MKTEQQVTDEFHDALVGAALLASLIMFLTGLLV